MALNLANLIEQMGKDKGIDKSILVEALESALIKAAERRFGDSKVIEGHFNEELGEIELFEFKTVVDEVTDEDTEISLEEARKFDPEAIIGDSLGLKLDSTEFGRIDAQMAKQIIIQKIRDAERDLIYGEYGGKKGDIVTGIVKRFEKGDIIIDLGRTEAVLPKREQVKRESYRQGDRLRAIILDVMKEAKGPQIILSRSHADMIVKLFDAEVPEIYEGIVEIKAAVREPGERAKIAVFSRDPAVDPVGACVGMKGSRVQVVVQELRGEKIDIVPWSEEPAVFAKNALSPAEISKVIVDPDEHSMEVIVPDDQLSLAIGKRGQNVRLAAKILGWKIDIHPESEAKGREISPDEALRKEMKAALAIESGDGSGVESLHGVGSKMAGVLKAAGFTTIEDLANASVKDLCRLEGIGEKKATKLLELAKKREDAAG